MSLEQLLNLSILSATSKEKDSFVKSPGIVSYITEQDIKRIGGNNLLDLLRRLPNIDSPSLYLFRDNVVSIRAQHSDATDTRVLILLNGRPMRETYNGGVNSPIYSGFPISSIAWIEVIRGPGSVLHGSGAFSGVINIVTKPAGASTKVNSSVSYGSFGTNILEASASTQSEDLALSGGVKLFTMDGWEYEANDGVIGDDFISHYGSNNYARDVNAITFNMSYQYLSLDYFESHHDNDVLGTTPDWPMIEAELDRRFLNVGFEYPINGHWKIDSYITYNRFDSFTGSENKTGSEDYLLEIDAHGKLTDTLSTIIGGTREKLTWYRHNEPKEHGTDFANRAYAELIYRPLKTLRLAAGMQYNEAPGASANTSPRLAATFQIDENWGAKLLYGEAFRAAIQIERFANIPGTYVGKEDLQPETIKTTDAQLFYYTDCIFTALTLYHSKEQDTIALDFGVTPTSHKNAKGYIYRGVEWELNWHTSKTIQFISSASYQQNENRETDVKNQKLTPQRMFKLGFNYSGTKGISLGLFNSYFSNYTQRSFTVVTNPAVNSRSSAYHHLSANLVFNLNHLLQYHSRYESTISLFGDNLLESDSQYAPDLGRSSIDINTLPIRPGRSLYLRYQMRM